MMLNERQVINMSKTYILQQIFDSGRIEVRQPHLTLWRQGTGVQMGDSFVPVQPVPWSSRGRDNVATLVIPRRSIPRCYWPRPSKTPPSAQPCTLRKTVPTRQSNPRSPTRANSTRRFSLSKPSLTHLSPGRPRSSVLCRGPLLIVDVLCTFRLCLRASMDGPWAAFQIMFNAS